MKKLVINLDVRQDRREHFEKNNSWLTDYTFFDAVNGRHITHEQMKANGFSINHQWRDPYKHRRITKGEVGCFLSHYSVWQRVIQLNEPVLILEDDCILNEELYDEALYTKMIEEGCGMLYLGYNENKPDEVKESDLFDMCEVPVYPYNTHAYIITPQTADTLVNAGFHRKIIPADEVLTKCLDRIENTLALKEHSARQALRADLGTDVEPLNDEDWFIDFETHAITIGTDTTKCVKLNDSAMKLGFSVKNIGANEDWHGTDMKSAGGGHKIVMLQEYLATLPENDVVLFTDAYDVFYLFDKDDITRRFMDFQCEILFSAETEIWPDPGMESKHPIPETKYRFLNSGGFIGRVGALKELFAEELKPDDDDQLYVQRRWLEDTTKWDMNLDYECYIFQTNEANMTIKDGLLYNEETGCYPAIYHGNGGEQAKQVFETYWVTMHGKPIESPFYIPHMGRVEQLEKDMLLVDFMTQSQCERMIEIADNHGGWAPLPGDKFPAYEIRIKELGQELWDELAQHWQDTLYPIIEKHWWPMQMYGLRDAFVMRYSVDTQKKLAMHNDASLVTGSVKLNDNYKGGILNFPRQGITNDDIPVGKMILFPGMVTHGHECTELLEGVKYSYTMWSSRYTGDEN